MFDQLYQDALNFFKDQDPLLHLLLTKAGKPTYLTSTQPRGLFSWLIGGIIGQKISFNRARMARMKLYTMIGKVDFTLQDLEKLKKEDWETLGVEQFQLKIIQKVIQETKDGHLKFDSLDDLEKWSQIKGIGPWTLNNIRIMYTATSLKKLPEIILKDDLVVKSALKSLYDQDLLTSQFLDQKKLDWFDSEKDQSYVGLINWYLWRYWRDYQKEIIKSN